MEGELEEIAKDELRLLIHAAHIQAQRDQGQLDAGEGEYWFIERYARRAAERLESLIIETQNYGLAVELLLLLELQSIAAEARFGAIEYAGEELEVYAGLLAEVSGTNNFFAERKEDNLGLVKWFSVIPIVRDHFQWPLEGDEVYHVAKLAKSRFENNPVQLLMDDFPQNNSREVLLVSGYLNTPNISRLWHLFLLPLSRQAVDMIALLLGFRDPRNTEEMMALMVVSLVPILDILNDLITFATNPSAFVKVIALVGIFLSLGEITTLLFPGALALGPPAVVADSMSTGVRAVYTGYGDVGAKAILDNLDDPVAIQWVTDLMRTGGRRILAEGDNLAEEGAPAVIRALVDTSLFDDYLSYARVAEAVGVLEEGADEGAILVGRILRQNVDLDLFDIDFHRQLKGWADELIVQGIDLSEDAAGGIGRAINELGSEGVERLKLGLQHTSGEFVEEEVELALDLVRRAGFEWTDEALEGVGLSTRLIGRNVTEQIFDLEFGSAEAFSIISQKPAGLWNETTGQGLARFFSHSFDPEIVRLPTPLETYYFDSISSYPDHVVEDVLRLFGSGDPQVPAHILNRLDDPRDLLQWVEKGNQLTVLEDLKNQGLIRRDIIEEELQEFWHEMLEFWNEGAQMEGRQLAEAVGVELPLYRLKQMGYEVIWVNPPGFQGPDAFLWNTILNKPVIFEGKGTLQSVTNLTGSYFPNTIFGRQLSRDWITNGADRYLRHIADEDVLRQIENILDQIRSGEPYEVIVGRGALNADILDSGSGLGNFIKAIDPGERNPGWSFLFIFVNRP
jgi:hypothetical protein